MIANYISPRSCLDLAYFCNCNGLLFMDVVNNIVQQMPTLMRAKYSCNIEAAGEYFHEWFKMRKATGYLLGDLCSAYYE